MQEVSKLSELATSNPQAVMQRYAQDPQVKYLLALNEAKRLKDAMQRNQAMQAPQQPTVMQALEQQSGLASLAAPPSQGEMAEDVGGVLQFQAKKQQENLQRMAQQGLPAAPGAATAMTPQAMAAGGIVAFSTGDQVPDLRSAAARLRERTREAGGEERDERRRRLRALAATYGFTEEQLRDPESLARQVVEDFDRAPPPGGDRVQPDEFQRGPEAGPAVRPPPTIPPGTTTSPEMRDVAQQFGQSPAGATPQAQAPTGPGATFPTLGEATTSREPTEFEKKTQASLQQSMAQNPLSMAEQVANSIQGRMAYTPEERRPAQQQRAGLEALLAERRASDRERQLSAFLRSAAGGRTFGETLGRASSGAAAAEEQAYRERLKGIEDLGKLGMEDVERGRFGRVEGAKQIGPMAKAGVEALSNAQRSATDLAGTISREGLGFAQLDQRHKAEAAELESKGLDRQNAFAIASMRQQTEAEVARATREATSEAQRGRLHASILHREGAEIARIQELYRKKVADITRSIVPGSPEEKQAKIDIEKARTEEAMEINRSRSRYARYLADLDKTGGATVTPAKD